MADYSRRIIWGAKLLKDGTLQETIIEGAMSTTTALEISSSLWSMFPTVTWAFMTSPSFIELGYFYIGREVEISFNDPERNTSISFIFCIYSVNNYPGSDPSKLGESISLTMVPRWVFHQENKSVGYKKSGSQIVSQIMDDELNSWLKPGTVVSSQDSPTRRFRTNQTPYMFLKTRVAPYLRGAKDTSIFFFTTLQDTYEVIDVDAMKRENSYVIISPSSVFYKQFSSDLADYEKNKQFLIAMSNSFSLGNSDHGGLWPLLDPKLITLATSQAGKVKNASQEPKLTDLTTNFSRKYVLASPNKGKDTGKVYMDDSLRRQEDIMSSVLTGYSKDLMDANKFTSPCYFNPYVKLGRLVRNYLTSSASNNLSLYNQTYIISGITHKAEGTLVSTIVEYTTTSFSANDTTQALSDGFLNVRS